MVVTGLGMGGAERVVCDLADKLYEKGYEVKIAYLVGNVLTYPIHDDIELLKVNLKGLGSLVPAYINLAKIVKKYKPDVVHSHMVHANLLSRLVRLIVPMSKLISTAHSNNEGGRGRMFCYRITHGLANRTTNVSKDAALAFESKGAVPKNAIKIIYNGINLDKFRYFTYYREELNEELGLDTDCKIILAVGRFNEAKDYPNLLNAVNFLRGKVNYSFKLLIAGDGELRPLLESMIKEKGLDSDVILLGIRKDIPKLMGAADLFVLSSMYEGFGLVVAEAMACECLVVATDCGGVVEVLNNPEFLVLPCDYIALSNKIEYALSMHVGIKKTTIQKNLKHVQDNFSLDTKVNEWIDLYNEN